MSKDKPIQRVKLSPEKRELLVRTYVERYIANNGELPTRRNVGEFVGGAITTILDVLNEYRGKIEVKEKKWSIGKKKK